MEESTESEIREKARARNSFRDAKHAKKMFDELVHCGFIRRIPQDRIEGGGRDPSPRIEINPHVRGSDLSDKRGLRLPTGNKSDKSEGEPHILKMSAEAQEGVYRLEQAKVEGMSPGGSLESVPAFAGKLPDRQ